MEHFDRKTGEPRLYDQIKNRLLTDADLPDGITLRDVCELLDAHYVQFFALGGVPKQGQEALDWDDPDHFRYGTIEFPSRGVTVQWDGVRKWIADRPERERLAAVAAETKATLDLLAAIFKTNAEYGLGFILNAAQVQALSAHMEKTHGV